MRTLALVALLAAPLAPPRADGQAPVQERFVSDLDLVVGEVRMVTAGPIGRVLCDRPGLVEVVSAKEGNGFRALAPGATTCSLTTADGVRRTLNVTVKKPEPPK